MRRSLSSFRRSTRYGVQLLSPEHSCLHVFQKNAFDIAQPAYQPCPFFLPVSDYLNTGSTQQELGVPLNFSYISNAVLSNFGVPSASTNRPVSAQSGDSVRQNSLQGVEYLLANDVKVAFIYGDRDYRCPWTGGLANALAAKWSGQNGLSTAGFEILQGVTKTGTDHGGVVKQYERFSFTRVFDSGHSVSAYAPETVFRIFDRTLHGVDAASGQIKVGNGFSTDGPVDSWQWQNTLPKRVPLTCIVAGQWTKDNPWTAVAGQRS